MDPSSPDVERASAFARALVTARGEDDLATYLELLAELRDQLAAAGAGGPATGAEDGVAAAGQSPEYLLGLVGSLSLIAAVAIRSAERSGLVTLSGQSLIAELFERLTTAGAHL